ncbi:hypothetical protein FRUB_04166 [Fimbriiglobus ruber]|uniref:Helix-turn-helix domain-containing protein n=1 Tax=Fimbriiglobus ruber TaxID=1908690 RepID=A0A225DU88_9BACT|nr:hypothetical protein FRUB_04166 [Fimbriiglobus ruber]
MKEAAARACISESLVYQWIADGTLPHFRVGAKGKRGKILIEVEDLDGVMAGFKVGKPEPTVAPAPKPVKPPQPVLRHMRLKP